MIYSTMRNSIIESDLVHPERLCKGILLVLKDYIFPVGRLHRCMRLFMDCLNKDLVSSSSTLYSSSLIFCRATFFLALNPLNKGISTDTPTIEFRLLLN